MWLFEIQSNMSKSVGNNESDKLMEFLSQVFFSEEYIPTVINTYTGENVHFKL